MTTARPRTRQSTSGLAILLAFLASRVVGQLDTDMHPLLASDVNLRGPGVRGRITSLGLSHITNVMLRTLLDEAVRMRLPSSSPFHMHNSSMRVSGMQLLGAGVASQIAPSVLTLPPNFMQTHAADIAMILLSEADGMLGGRSLKTPMLMNATGMRMLVELAVGSDAVGVPVLKINKCDFPVGFPLVVSYNRTLPEEARQQLVSLASHDAINIFRRTLCPRLSNLIETRINARFAMLPPRISLARAADIDLAKLLAEAERMKQRMKFLHRRVFQSRRKAAAAAVARTRFARQARGGGATLANMLGSFDFRQAENLFLDYSMPQPPVASADGLDISSSGEIAPLGVPTPFGPRPLPLFGPAPNDASMLQIALSDYVPNTLMYHGHKTRLFNARVDPSTPHFGGMMRSSCDLSTGSLFCVGDLFPTLRQALPNRGIAFLFSTLRAPVMIARPEALGGIFLALNGMIEVRAIDAATRTETAVGRMTVDIQGSMRMRMTSKFVKGKITLDSIVLRTLTPGVFAQDELDDAGFLSHEIIQRMVNDILKDGIPVPVHPLFRLRMPRLTLADRAIMISTQFELNQKLIRQLTAAELPGRKHHHVAHF